MAGESLSNAKPEVLLFAAPKIMPDVEVSRVSIDEFRVVLGGQPTPFCFYPLSRVTRNCKTGRHQ